MGWANNQLLRDLARLGIYPIGKGPREPLEPQQPDEEYRCKSCKAKSNCPAFETGVAFPCQYYLKEE